MKLNYKRIGKGQPLLILHGLLGMLDNWLTPAKTLAEHFEVILIDQRNHGHSPHDSEHSYQDMMEDLEELVDDLFLHDFHLLGHSMGGKTAMKFAQHNPDLIDKLIVADIAPKAYPVHHDKILEGLSAVDFSAVKSRGEVNEVLKNYIAEEGVRQFLSKNLYWKEKGRLAWRFNLEAIKNNIEIVGEAVQDRLYDKPTLFVQGADSNYITEQDYSEIKTVFPKAEIEVMPNTGHWVHAQNPKLFLEIVLKYLKS